MNPPINLNPNCLRVGMVGLGMIFDETYRPLLEQLHREPLFRPDYCLVQVELAAAASRTGVRGEKYKQSAGDPDNPVGNCTGPYSVGPPLRASADAACG